MVNKFHHPRGGSETVVFQTARMFRARGHEVFHFSMRHPANLVDRHERHFVSGVDYDDIGGGSIGRARAAARVLYNWEARRRLEELVRDVRPDVAHLHNIYHQLSPSIFGALRKFRVPTVMTVHDYKLVCPNHKLARDGKVCEACGDGRFHRAISRRCVKNSLGASLVCAAELYLHRWARAYEQGVDLFLAPSAFLVRKHSELGFDTSRFRVLPVMTEGVEARPSTIAGDYVFFAGSLIPEKGIKTLLEAMALIGTSRLVIAGEGPLLPELERLAKKRGLDVAFKGFVTGDKLGELIGGCSFVAAPSLWYENFPSVVLEAFALGKPVVGSRVGGIPELIEHGANGLLVPAGDAGRLAGAMAGLLANPAAVERMGRNARLKAEREYAPGVHYARLMSIYRELTSHALTSHAFG